ncbi:MAG: cytochrome c biogenesis protein CcdA [Desulfosalsimonas sp.]
MLSITSARFPDKIRPGRGFEFELVFELKDGWHINSHRPNSDYMIPSRLGLAAEETFFLESVQYPEPEKYEFDFADGPVSVFDDSFSVTGTIRASRDIEPGTYELPFQFDYQACRQGTCLKPDTAGYSANIRVEGTAPGHGQEERVIDNEEGRSAPSVAGLEDGISTWIDSAGLFLGVLLVFIGGLALNLTPCVYPIIPITISYFGSQSEGRTRRLFILGLLYVAGMALAYSIIGVITAMTGAVFGGLLQDPRVMIGIAGFFVLMALSMFGVYEFRIPRRLTDAAGGARAGLLGALLMGLTMGVVAAPCVGPLVLGLVAYVAAKGDPVFGFLLFFFLALGLGMPYLFLAVFSGKIKALPGSGEWMEAVRRIFGLVLTGAAIYFVAPFLPGFLNTGALPVFSIIAAVYLLFFDKTANKIRGFKKFKILLCLFVIGISVYALAPGDRTIAYWEEFSREGYERALENNRKMVIVYHADWCIPCRQLKRQTLSDPAVVEKLQEFKVLAVDMTHPGDREIREIQSRFDVQGVPTLVIIDSKGNLSEQVAGMIRARDFIEILSRVK